MASKKIPPGGRTGAVCVIKPSGIKFLVPAFFENSYEDLMPEWEIEADIAGNWVYLPGGGQGGAYARATQTGTFGILSIGRNTPGVPVEGGQTKLAKPPAPVQTSLGHLGYSVKYITDGRSKQFGVPVVGAGDLVQITFHNPQVPSWSCYEGNPYAAGTPAIVIGGPGQTVVSYAPKAVDHGGVTLTSPSGPGVIPWHVDQTPPTPNSCANSKGPDWRLPVGDYTALVRVAPGSSGWGQVSATTYGLFGVGGADLPIGVFGCTCTLTIHPASPSVHDGDRVSYSGKHWLGPVSITFGDRSVATGGSSFSGSFTVSSIFVDMGTNIYATQKGQHQVGGGWVVVPPK